MLPNRLALSCRLISWKEYHYVPKCPSAGGAPSIALLESLDVIEWPRGILPGDVNPPSSPEKLLPLEPYLPLDVLIVIS